MITGLENLIKQQAPALGFDLAAIAPPPNPDAFAHPNDWLNQGFAGEMN